MKRSCDNQKPLLTQRIMSTQNVHQFYRFKILYSEEPFEVASLENFGLERQLIVLTLNPLEG